MPDAFITQYLTDAVRQSTIFRGQGCMQRKEVRLGEQLIHRDKLHTQSLRLRIHANIINPHAETGRTSRHSRTDPPAANNAQRFVMHIAAPRGLPFALAHLNMTGVNTACYGQQQAKRRIRHRLIQQAGRVGYHDAFSSSRGNIDRVVADAPARITFKLHAFLHSST
jgi:hypothetical protein